MKTVNGNLAKKSQEIIDRVSGVLKDRSMSQANLADLLEEKGVQPNTPGSVRRYLKGENIPRLNWLLGVADVLNLDYRWLLTGNENGWDELPEETVTLWNIDAETENPILAFDIPEGWDRLNLRIFLENLPPSISAHVTRGK